ncbi:UNVERIFIED_ORG: hypothetical protein EDC92_12446 [Dietzia maris]
MRLRAQQCHCAIEREEALGEPSPLFRSAIGVQGQSEARADVVSSVGGKVCKVGVDYDVGVLPCVTDQEIVKHRSRLRSKELGDADNEGRSGAVVIRRRPLGDAELCINRLVSEGMASASGSQHDGGLTDLVTSGWSLGH